MFCLLVILGLFGLCCDLVTLDWYFVCSRYSLFVCLVWIVVIKLAFAAFEFVDIVIGIIRCCLLGWVVIALFVMLVGCGYLFGWLDLVSCNSVVCSCYSIWCCCFNIYSLVVLVLFIVFRFRLTILVCFIYLPIKFMVYFLRLLWICYYLVIYLVVLMTVFDDLLMCMCL